MYNEDIVDRRRQANPGVNNTVVNNNNNITPVSSSGDGPAGHNKLS